MTYNRFKLVKLNTHANLFSKIKTKKQNQRVGEVTNNTINS